MYYYTYVYELVADSLNIEMIMNKSYKMSMLVFPVDEPYLMLGDNMSVIFRCFLPSISLKNNHVSI